MGEGRREYEVLIQSAEDLSLVATGMAEHGWSAMESAVYVGPAPSGLMRDVLFTMTMTRVVAVEEEGK